MGAIVIMGTSVGVASNLLLAALQLIGLCWQSRRPAVDCCEIEVRQEPAPQRGSLSLQVVLVLLCA
eukprot:6188181-Amphidinium_carterae.1